MLVYPVTDVAGNFADTEENARFPSRSENAEGYFLTRATMEWFCGHYLADSAHGTDWRVSPLRAKNLAGLAPAIVATAWFDPLRDEGKAYADALAAAGVPTSYYDGLGLIHGYFGLGEASETAKREAQRARADFKALLRKGRVRGRLAACLRLFVAIQLLAQRQDDAVGGFDVLDREVIGKTVDPGTLQAQGDYRRSAFPYRSARRVAPGGDAGWSRMTPGLLFPDH